ncbi:MAG TPA: hypothetical protein VNO21_14820 [Polyangiaceae bacterium]|nr:hypothetical protein [Polyangiaceae bacterium]
MKGEFHGSDLLTGGSFGPEASIVAIVVCLSAGIFFFTRARRVSHAEKVGRDEEARLS